MFVENGPYPIPSGFKQASEERCKFDYEAAIKEQQSDIDKAIRAIPVMMDIYNAIGNRTGSLLEMIGMLHVSVERSKRIIQELITRQEDELRKSE